MSSKPAARTPPFPPLPRGGRKAGGAAKAKPKPAEPARKPRHRAVTGSLFTRGLSVPTEEAAALLRTLYRIRLCEDRLCKLPAGSPARASARAAPGGEAVAAGACAALRADDHVISADCGCGPHVARGVPVQTLLAGTAPGRTEPGAAAARVEPVMSDSVAVAAGAALVCKLDARQQVVLCFVSAAAADRGAFHEAARLAARWRLPLVFVCENSQPLGRSRDKNVHKGGHISARAGSYGMEGVSCDGGNVLEVRETVAAACEQARNGQGPTLIEAVTHRGPLRGAGAASLPQEEQEQWQRRDPTEQFRLVLAEADAVAPKQADAIEAEVALEVGSQPQPLCRQQNEAV